MPSRADVGDSPFLTDYDLHLLAAGAHYRSYEKLGAHLTRQEGAAGAHFAVWAPNALSVAVVGDFNGWDPDADPMRLRAEAGVWEVLVPGVESGALYKYQVTPRDGGDAVQKADPYAFAAELRPPHRVARLRSVGLRMARCRLDDEPRRRATGPRRRSPSTRCTSGHGCGFPAPAAG